MVKKKMCPYCGSGNCEESVKRIVKRKANLYPPRAKVSSVWLCYHCGAGETTYGY